MDTNLRPNAKLKHEGESIVVIAIHRRSRSPVGHALRSARWCAPIAALPTLAALPAFALSSGEKGSAPSD